MYIDCCEIVQLEIVCLYSFKSACSSLRNADLVYFSSLNIESTHGNALHIDMNIETGGENDRCVQVHQSLRS